MNDDETHGTNAGLDTLMPGEQAADGPPSYPSGGASCAHPAHHPDLDKAAKEADSNETTTPVYHDRFITCTATTLTIRAYYFPWGSKTIPLATVRRVEVVPLGALTGRGRVWGTANPGVWAHLDPARPSKTKALLLDIGQSVRPLITPTDLPALVEVMEMVAGLEVVRGQARFV